MQSLREIRDLLASRGLRPKHRLGQNFLHDKNQITRLVAAAAIEPGEVVLEVGPGTGTLTEALLDAGATVVASEIDRDLGDLLEERLGSRITLVRGDCLETGRRLSAAVRAAIGERPFVLVANLPYQVASPLMGGLLVDEAPCRGQFVTIQLEVADRLLAPPGGKTYGPLGIIVQAFAEVKRIGTVKPSCFWPAPKVTSAMVAVRPRHDVRVRDRAAFARFVTELFSKRRKQVGTIFGRDRTWPAGVTEHQRPEALTIEQIIALSET